jgi:hypothetical protein
MAIQCRRTVRLDQTGILQPMAHEEDQLTTLVNLAFLHNPLPCIIYNQSHKIEQLNCAANDLLAIPAENLADYAIDDLLVLVPAIMLSSYVSETLINGEPLVLAINVGIDKANMLQA